MSQLGYLMLNSAIDFAMILQGMPQPYLVLDAELKIVGASNAYLTLTDRQRSDIVGRHILEAFPDNPEAAGTVEQGPLEVSLRHVLATGQPHEMAVIQYDIPEPGGGFRQKFWTPIHTPVLGADGRVEYIIQNPMDVTARVVEAREADARLRVALHAADLGSWEYEPETDIWRRSQAVDDLFGFAPGEAGPVAAPFFARMHPEDLTRVTEVVQSAMDCPDQTVMNYGYRILLPSGEVRHVTSRGEVLRDSAGKVRMIGVMMDVTADRAREEQLALAVEKQEELLQQKDLLLAEVNHRVKNSLQLVVSTLRLQSRRLDEAAAKEALDHAISRVRAIVSVHERLYRTDNSLRVDMADHLQKLCFDLAGDAGTARVRVKAQALDLPTERAIPLSVIVNELVATALKQPGLRQGPIEISLVSLDAEKAELTIRDAAAPHEVPASSSLESKLIAAMAAQVEGDFRWSLAGRERIATLVFSKDIG